MFDKDVDIIKLRKEVSILAKSNRRLEAQLEKLLENK
jgi:hypothetical protein